MSTGTCTSCTNRARWVYRPSTASGEPLCSVHARHFIAKGSPNIHPIARHEQEPTDG